MQIPVLIEPIDGNGYRARGAEPLGFVAEGPTRETALAKLKELVQARLRQGAEIVSMDLAQEPHPFANSWACLRTIRLLRTGKRTWLNIGERKMRNLTFHDVVH